MRAKTTKSTHAYTSGLKVKKIDTVRKFRRLPIPGEVLVKVGDKVSPTTTVARTKIPGDPQIIVVASQLGCLPEQVPGYMKKKSGETIKENEMLAQTDGFFGMFKTACYSSGEGIIEDVSGITGQCIIRGLPIPVEVKAYIPGRVIEVQENEGAIIEAKAAFIQGIIGIGGETHGELKLVVESRSDPLEDHLIEDDANGKILIGGSSVTLEALHRAKEVGATGVVSGSIDNRDLIDFMGSELGLAITGNEELGLTLIITEGFGEMAMSNRAFEIVKMFNGNLASINGITQIRAGVIRPEIIIPYSDNIVQKIEPDDKVSSGMTEGTPVRIIREPYFGIIGQIHSLPIELKVIGTGSKVRVARIRIGDEDVVTVPRSNLELIEE